LKIKKEDDIDKMWETLLFALIGRCFTNFLPTGEQFEDPKVIGMGLSLRTKERLLEVWLKDGKNEKVKKAVSQKMRRFLKCDPETTTLYYKDHD